jgi:aryl-alcohol dehydrogenase-like predicted oxidoreductase
MSNVLQPRVKRAMCNQLSNPLYLTSTMRLFARSLVSNQVQFSLIDQRPLAQMAQYCEKEGVKLLAVSKHKEHSLQSSSSRRLSITTYM